MSRTVNGVLHEPDPDAEMPPLRVLRDLPGMPGTKYGCGIGVCGACTVHLNGEAVRSCQILAGDLAGAEITTIEGLGTPVAPHPVQAAWTEMQVARCGYCQSGQIMQAAALLAEEMDLNWGDFEVSFGKPAKADWNRALGDDMVPFRANDDGLLAETMRGGADIAMKLMGFQSTGGSTTGPDSFVKQRAAGAMARETLKAAAARRSGVPTADLRSAGAARCCCPMARASPIPISRPRRRRSSPSPPPRCAWRAAGGGRDVGLGRGPAEGARGGPG